MSFYTPTGRLKVTRSQPAPPSAARTWGPYFDAMFPPREVSTWIGWKIASTGTNIAKRLWRQREEMRRAYETVHGSDPGLWPTQHPPVVLDAVPWVAHAACLRCHWFDAGGHYMKHPEGRARAFRDARRHRDSKAVSR